MALQRIACIIAIAAALGASACASECLGPSHNRSVPDPGAGEFQLVMNNGLSRDEPLFVDGKEIGAICSESEKVVIGNFKVNQCTTVRVKDEVHQCFADFGPCSGRMCEPSACGTCFDTHLVAGSVLDLRMCWEGSPDCGAE